MKPEAEFITIVEGPPPEFRPVVDSWAWSLVETNQPYSVAACDMRSLKGRVLRDRCTRVWSSGRQIKLDFPTLSGLRQQLEIISVRLEELPEGDLFHVWVRHAPNEIKDPSEQQ